MLVNISFYFVARLHIIIIRVYLASKYYAWTATVNHHEKLYLVNELYRNVYTITPPNRPDSCILTHLSIIT